MENPVLAAHPLPPPTKVFKRARSGKVFCELFKPMLRAPADYQWEFDEIPKLHDEPEWWTIVDHEPSSPRWYLVPGVVRSNSIAAIDCGVRWAGDAHDHPIYVY